eukprot:TRINITY_DN0_c569_g1_i1.p1 TRINITY_DN0_c569_g1~~TRINITY_DN0_c569_g1_i1.p1  ORF type:complete len:142 (-),score=42.43 TRINITY_DN0_c569_g1_i1:20-445(-)
MVVPLAWIADYHYFNGNAFIFGLLYIWCKKCPFEKVQFLFGFIVTSAYLPWILLVYDLIIGGSIVPNLIGIAAGHTYIFLKDILPNSHRINVLKTPKFFEKLVLKAKGYKPVPGNIGGRFQQAPPEPQGWRPFQGQGVRLQ